IVCVGERLEEQQSGITAEVVRKQIKLALLGISKEDVKKVVVAYEPIWAIGTGKTATSDDANQTIKEIRDAIREVFSNAADEVRIQYGGSMNPKNASELMAMSDIDGGLIGGASLKAEDFSKVVNF
ncbi:MAG: triose-phosphate isomerase, partial [Christensenellaceae bacterium]